MHLRCSDGSRWRMKRNAEMEKKEFSEAQPDAQACLAGGQLLINYTLVFGSYLLNLSG